jgi:hypothetical protein
MTSDLIYMLKLIHVNDNFMQLPATLAALEQWICAIVTHLYSQSPKKLKEYYAAGMTDVLDLFSVHIAHYEQSMKSATGDPDPWDTSVWEHELSDLTFWSILITVNSYIAVVRAVNEATRVPDDIAALFRNPRGLQYISQSLAIGALLRSAESIGRESGVNIAQLLDGPSCLTGHSGYSDIIAWFQSDLFFDYRTLQLGMLLIHTNTQAIQQQALEVFLGLFLNHLEQWLLIPNGAAQSFAGFFDKFEFGADDWVTSLELRNNVWVARFEFAISLTGGPCKNNTGSGRLVIEITLPDTLQAVPVARSGNNAADMWHMLEAFLDHSLQEMTNGNRLIGTTDYYMEVLLPEGFTVKTTNELLKELRVMEQKQTPDLLVDKTRRFSVTRTLAAAYLRLIGLSDYLDRFRRRGNDFSSEYCPDYGLSVQRFAAAMWLNIGFQEDAWLNLISGKGLNAIPAELRDYLSTVLRSLDHGYDLQPGSMHFTGTRMVRSFASLDQAAEGQGPAVSMLTIAAAFSTVYENNLRGGTFTHDNNDGDMAKRELMLFKLWLSYMAMLAAKEEDLDRDVIKHFIEEYQSLLLKSGNPILGRSETLLSIATSLAGSLVGFDPGNMSRQLLMAFSNIYTLEASDVRMTSQQTVSWTLLVTAILSTLNLEYVADMMPLFQRHIWHALRIYDINTGSVPEPYDLDASNPITGFLDLYDFLLGGMAKEFGEAAGKPKTLSDLKTRSGEGEAAAALATYSLLINQSVVWLGCVPSAIVHHFIQSGRGWKDAEPYIRSFELLSNATGFGYALMARYPLLVEEAIRSLGQTHELTGDELEQWTGAILGQVLPVLNKGTVRQG